MAKITMVRLVETPYWAQAAEFRADEKLQINREGNEIHLCFGDKHPARGRGLSHVVVPMSRVDYFLLEDEPAKDAKK